MKRIIYLIFIASALSGCATTAPLIDQEFGRNFSTSTSAFDYAGGEELIPGEVVEVTGPEFPQKIKVKVGEKYHSALGFVCHQIVVADTEYPYETIVLCKSDSSTWTIVPRIWARSKAGQR